MTSPQHGSTVLTIDDLQVWLPTSSGGKQIICGIGLKLRRGHVLGLAGESGSGKTMTALAIMGLLPPGAKTQGTIDFHPEGTHQDLLRLSNKQLNQIRGRRIGMVFQDPSTSLHPQLKVGTQLTDQLRHHLKMSKAQAKQRALSALEEVKVPSPAEALEKYPHQFSGGQRQRIAIAVALACNPDVLLADEPTTALDVTVQAGILGLVRRLANERDLAVLFVTHDLGVMSAIADQVAVMRDGALVELGERQQVFHDPTHPYTRGLLASLPGSEFGLESLDDIEERFADLEDRDGLEVIGQHAISEHWGDEPAETPHPRTSSGEPENTEPPEEAEDSIDQEVSK